MQDKTPREKLIRKLIEKNYFQVGTEVDATFRGLDLSGVQMHYFESTFTVASLLESKKSGLLILELVSTADGNVIRVKTDSIKKIDGMTPERFGENYMIAEDGGELKPTGRRRGRRPKGWTPDNDDFYMGDDD
jgi:hypothetical protein